MVLSFQWSSCVCLSEDWQSGVLRCFLGHKIWWKIYEICQRTNINKRIRLVLCHIFPPWRVNNSNWPLQLDWNNNINKASWSRSHCLRHVQNPHHRMLLKLHIHVAVQKPNFKIDHVRAFLSGRISQNGKRNMLVCWWQTRHQPNLRYWPIRQHKRVRRYHLCCSCDRANVDSWTIKWSFEKIYSASHHRRVKIILETASFNNRHQFWLHSFGPYRHNWCFEHFVSQLPGRKCSLIRKKVMLGTEMEWRSSSTTVFHGKE